MKLHICDIEAQKLDENLLLAGTGTWIPVGAKRQHQPYDCDAANHVHHNV